ncbi:MAG TPA: DEAD/DEAH box helicase [Acidimicrobiia bacterium]|nr:DEAD/DEAH box helicase [Acidimicrobiia bacterium]
MHPAVASWLADPERADRIAHVETVAERRAIFEDLDPPMPDDLRAALAERGIDRLYRHQAQAIKRARAGTHTVVVAGTASGKSLGYQVPILEAALEDRAATALLLFPTKALARDQFRAMHAFGIPEVTPVVYDGDTDSETRSWARKHATVVMTNPDMLHVGILPSHGKWATFFRRLQYVVIDEVHVLRGIFGSHVGNVVRRLRRVARHYGADPTFLGSSATIGNPGELMSALTGLPVDVVEQDASPAGVRHYVLWNPELEEDDTRRSPLAETTDLFVDLVGRGEHTIAFARSRKGVELVYRWARERLDLDLADRIAPYRAGYLPEQRREIEERLFSGELLGVTATNALELGIDVGGLDAAIVATFPGTVASFRQQTGRAGRSTEESLSVLVAGQDALDQWYVNHPGDLFGRPSEAAVVNPANPHILAGHMGCAAYEIPMLSEDAVATFGPEVESLAADLVSEGALRIRNGRLLWAGRGAPAPAIDIRTAGGPPYTIVDTRGEVMGTVDESRVFSQAHPGAVYLHQGDSYVIENLSVEDRLVRARPGEVGYYTQPEEDTTVEVRVVLRSGAVGRFGHRLGDVEVESRVTGFKRKKISDRSVISYEPLDLPPRRYETQAIWFTVDDDLLRDAGIATVDLPGTLHAAEHTGIAMLPLFAICDRWDIGGLSTPFHAATGMPVWFIYDGYPGGAGIAPLAYQAGTRHLSATLEALRTCPCDTGCPSCVQSPKCGNFNEPLDKAGAIRLLEVGLG